MSKKIFFILLAAVISFPPLIYASTTLTRLPSDVTILTSDDFRKNNYYSVADALQSMMPLDIERDGGRGTRALLKMRGSRNAASTLILIDGVPVNPDYDSSVDLTQIPINMVSRLEITRGGVRAAYGAEASGGAVNIVTFRPQDKGVDARLGTYVGRYGTKGSHLQFMGRSRLADFTYMTSQEVSGNFSFNEDYRSNNHFGNISQSFKGKGFWGAEYLFHDSRVGVSHGTYIPFSQWNSELEKRPNDEFNQHTQESQHAKVYLGSPLIAGGTFYTSYTESYRTFDDRLTDGGTSVHHEKNRTGILNLKWVRGGFEAGIDRRDRTRELFPSSRSKTNQTGAYIMNEWKSDKWTFLPSLRVDDNSQFGSFVSPRAVIVYGVSKKFLLSSTITRSFRAPTYDELYFSTSAYNNPNLNPEKTWTYNIGQEWMPHEHFHLRLTQFYSRTTDVIAQDAVTYKFKNRGHQTNAGTETDISAHVGEKSRFHNFSLRLQWTYVQSRLSYDNQISNITPAMTPTHVIVGHLDYLLPNSTILTNEVHYKSEQFQFDNRTGLRVPSHYVWNIRLKKQILSADLFFVVENVNRRHYAESFATFQPAGGALQTVLSPQPTRTFWAGASIRFKN